MNDESITTSIVHADRRAGVEHGAIRQPMHASIQYEARTVEDLVDVFQGRTKGAFNYARQGTPTTAALESKITRLEGGLGTICFSTGMAALAALFLSLLKAGDHLISSRYVFGNTHSLFGTLQGLGIEVSMVEAGDVSHVEAAIRPNTRMVFVETIANPGTQIPDLVTIGALCRHRSLLYVVDNTITSPVLFQPASVGASLVVNSLSKTLAGHGAALGGAITDTGHFDWSSYPNISLGYRKGESKQWGLMQVRKKALRDMGASLSPEQAQQIAIGAETVELRVERSSASALALARSLESHPAVARVFYPGLANHPQHARGAELFQASSWLLSFELRDVDAMYKRLNRLRLAVKATGLGDTRTLVIPVAPTIFWEAGAEIRASMGISDGLVRVSVGLEAASELIADFGRALDA